MSISIGLTDLRHRHTQVRAFRENNCRVVPRILTILQHQLGQAVDISGHLWNEQRSVQATTAVSKAVKPASRPNMRNRIVSLCDSAVERIRLINSAARLMAVWKPIQ